MLTYNNFKKKLENRYVVVSKGNEKVYFDEEDRIAAYEKDNAITTWHQCHQDDLWNHYDCVAVTIVKGMDLPSKKSYKGYARYDALYVVGLCGAYNYVERFGTYAVSSGCSSFIELDPDFVPARKSSAKKKQSSNMPKMSSKTYPTCDGKEISVVYQQDFDRLPYDQKISFLQDSTGACFDGAIIDHIKVLPSNPGLLSIEEGIDGKKTNSLQFLHGIVPLGKVFRNGDIFHIQNDFFQMNIPNLRGYFDDTPIMEPILPVAKLKKYGNVSPPDIEIPIDRWGYADKVYNSMVDSVCPGQKATIYQKSHSFRRR